MIAPGCTALHAGRTIRDALRCCRPYGQALPVGIESGDAVAIADLRTTTASRVLTGRGGAAGACSLYHAPWRRRLGALIVRDTPGPLTHDMATAQTLQTSRAIHAQAQAATRPAPPPFTTTPPTRCQVCPNRLRLRTTRTRGRAPQAYATKRDLFVDLEVQGGQRPHGHQSATSCWSPSRTAVGLGGGRHAGQVFGRRFGPVRDLHAREPRSSPYASPKRSPTVRAGRPRARWEARPRRHRVRGIGEDLSTSGVQADMACTRPNARAVVATRDRHAAFRRRDSIKGEP